MDKPLKLTIERPREGNPAETIEVTVTPDNSPTWVDPVDQIPPRLEAAGCPRPRPGPGDRAQDPVGEGGFTRLEGRAQAGCLTSIDDFSTPTKAAEPIFTMTRSADEKSDTKPVPIELDGKSSGWPAAFDAVQRIPWKSIELTVAGSDKPIAITPVVDQAIPPGPWAVVPGLAPETAADGPRRLSSRGCEETVDSITSVFRIFRSMSQGRVGRDAVGGVIPIAKLAYDSASGGWTPFIQFLGFLSVNLAVLNSLPIPPLDGGQFLFLTAEKVRGRPLPEHALNFLRVAGLVFVLFLILFINGKDLFNVVKSYF